MDFRQLNYFIAVYESGSVSAGARRLGISQPTLSAAIMQLETQLQVCLFRRIPKGVVASEDAERLYGHACNLLNQLQAVQNTFSPAPARVQFKLGLAKALGVERMSQLLKEFQQQAANLSVQLELVLVEPDDPCDARIINIKHLRAGEDFTPLWKDLYQLALPAQHPLVLKPLLTLSDFHKLPMIKRTPCEAWSVLYPQLLRQGIKPDIRADIHTIEYAVGLVTAGVGAALVPNFDAFTQRTDIVLKSFNELTLPRELGLASPRLSCSPLLNCLRQLCKQIGE
jgi:DNA-binding transcriptional LysR family regulator